MSNVNLLKIFECNYTYLKVTGGEKIFMKFICYILTLLAVTAPAYGQETNVISEHKDWTVYADGDLCWAATQPDFSLSKYKRGGKILKKTPDRGDEKYIALTIAFEKGKPQRPNVTYSAGNFEFSENASNAKLYRIIVRGSNFKDKSFFLAPYNNAGMGWVYPLEEEEADIINLLKKGANTSVTVVSKRGTVITDTFSLIGVSAAVNQANEKCS